MKNIAILSILLLFCIQINAQQKGPHISFETKTHDFGKIFEEDGNVSVKYVFSNTGTVPVIIQQVRSSCGCTTPDWTKTPVNPGKKGFVMATFSPRGRSGNFAKTVSVTTNAEMQPIVLRLKGEVVKKQADFTRIYPSVFGNIRAKKEYVPFGRINNTDSKVKYVDLYNPTDKMVKLTAINTPSHISVTFIPALIPAKGTGKMSITYNASKNNNWDYSLDRFNLKVNGNRISRNITVTATIQEDFSKMSEKELAKAPKINFKEKIFDFGTIKQGEKVEFEFEFTNEGKDDLVIRKTRASCGCTAVNMAEKQIKSGKSGKIKAIFNSAGKIGKQTKTITIISNDPKNSRVVLWIKGVIEK